MDAPAKKHPSEATAARPHAAALHAQKVAAKIVADEIVNCERGLYDTEPNQVLLYDGAADASTKMEALLSGLTNPLQPFHERQLCKDGLCLVCLVLRCTRLMRERCRKMGVLIDCHREAFTKLKVCTPTFVTAYRLFLEAGHHSLEHVRTLLLRSQLDAKRKPDMTQPPPNRPLATPKDLSRWGGKDNPKTAVVAPPDASTRRGATLAFGHNKRLADLAYCTDEAAATPLPPPPPPPPPPSPASNPFAFGTPVPSDPRPQSSKPHFDFGGRPGPAQCFGAPPIATEIPFLENTPVEPTDQASQDGPRRFRPDASGQEYPIPRFLITGQLKRSAAPVSDVVCPLPPKKRAAAASSVEEEMAEIHAEQNPTDPPTDPLAVEVKAEPADEIDTEESRLVMDLDESPASPEPQTGETSIEEPAPETTTIAEEIVAEQPVLPNLTLRKITDKEAEKWVTVPQVEDDIITKRDMMKQATFFKKQTLYECVFCLRNYKTESWLTRHIKEKHAHSEENICGVCDRTFIPGDEGTRHMVRHLMVMHPKYYIRLSRMRPDLFNRKIFSTGE